MVDVDAIIVLSHLIAMTHHGRIPGFELNDVKTGLIDARLTGRAQSATCLFCRKTIVSWKGRPASRRAGARSAMPEVLDEAMREHTPVCAEEWMWSVLSRWSIGMATPHERRCIELWRARHVRFDRPGSTVIGAAMATVFERLPRPPGSDVAQELEVALIAISRLWDH